MKKITWSKREGLYFQQLKSYGLCVFSSLKINIVSKHQHQAMYWINSTKSKLTLIFSVVLPMEIMKKMFMHFKWLSFMSFTIQLGFLCCFIF